VKKPVSKFAFQVHNLRRYSEGRNELDKGGLPCTVYDAVFNDDVVKQAVAGLYKFVLFPCYIW
jgi:hypothetical protein